MAKTRAGRGRRGGRCLRWTLWGVLAAVALAIAGMLVWSQVGVMSAEPEPLARAEANPGLVIDDAPQGVVLTPAAGGSTRGLVFIPGAKVQPEAYIAILQDVAVEHGVSVVITRPWLNLAFFDPRGMDAFTSAAPNVDTWMVGGHSLGGVRGCQLAGDADALVLFASYCAADLSGSGLPVLSISGSEDGLSTPQKIADARDLLPADAEMVQIDGAAHASFGDYGPQAGDGTPSISDDDMRTQITELVSGLADELG
ncbi:alpha/beta hydrolase [Microbacterium esteraromaticum]|uniref:alpha/beta hydrolase n=1 Tax=Microbacterium esteraromaticum TaxID=57043 RepID=UPI0023684594|nr:alpha/beta hydrolase [Microbacterium esteraromaticum]WDH77983.1 alpha/beta hydrolase [Microbacterium esteraromaticum]